MEIDTYGNVDTLYYVFNGIASFMGSGSFSGFMRFTLLSGLLIAMVAAIGRKSTDIVKWFASAMVLTQLLVAPVENVFITDVTGVQPTREVDHVPAYLSAIAQASTTVSTAVTQAYETVFSVPDSLQLQKGDLGFGISVLQKVNQAQIVDTGLEADLMQFFKECTVYDIQDGAINPQTIMSGTDPFNTVFTQTSPARYVTTNTLTANPTTDTCLATGTLLLIRVTDAEQKAEQMYGKEMYPQMTDASAAKAAFVNAIGDSYGFILQSSQNASSALRQAMFNNVWRQAGADLPAMLNDPARVAEVNALMSSAQAAVAANGSMASVAILAKETLPTVRNYAEAIIYTIFPIVIVLCLVGGGEAAKRILGGYAKTIAWIGLWPVIFAVLNGLSLMHLSSKMQAMSLQAGVPFGMAAKFGSTLIDEQVLLGYMVILTPALAWGLLNMATTSVVGAFQGVMGGFQGIAQQIGGQQAQGDENIGSVHMDTSSIGNSTRNVTSANKYDTAGLFRTGSTTIDQGTGSSFTNFDNGLITRADTQSSLGFALSSQSAIEKSVGTDTSTGMSASQTSSAFSGREKLASSTTSFSNGQDRGTSQRSGDEAATGVRGSTTQTTDLRRSIEQQYGIDQAHTVEDQISAGAKGALMLGGSYEKSFGGEAPGRPAAGGGAGAPHGARQGGPGNLGPGTGNPASNSPLYHQQAEEDRLAQRAAALGKSPEEVQKVREGYRQRATAADYANGGGTGTSTSSGRIGADFSGEAGYTHLLRDAAAEKFVDQYGSFAGYTQGAQVSHEASANHTEYAGAESSQHARSEHSASLTEQASSGSRDAADLTRTADVRQRGSTQNVSRVDTTNNLLTPENLQAVAARNGMRYGRLMTMPAAEIQRLVSEDALMRDIVRRNSALPPTARDGSPLPSGHDDIVRQNKHDRARISADVPGAFQRFANDVGPVDTTALDVKPSVPSEVSGAQARVDAVRQRVSDDADLPIRQVQDHVIPSDDNRSLMTLDRSPARPLVTKPAVGSQGTPSPTRLSEADFKILPADGPQTEEAAAPSARAAVSEPTLPQADIQSVPVNDAGKSTALSARLSAGPSGEQKLSETDIQIVSLEPKGEPKRSGERQALSPASVQPGEPARTSSEAIATPTNNQGAVDEN
ncbi:conjugal transfer protein TraG N-terminal domain-containing protein [Burkholderia glumae]|uniref:conjugal transfer protein TraG N-terminal domain-containing protein n=1 Tax=Burkholderia glumae TaxID=337 RepID=UPI0020CD8794|nr:conjugal transfer protein TraG N-terminal domain-containing protein [Burkholderia glumae]MCQ0034472.1 conjugal transfer protein TraG N-terminal domain-containing protein [Burkholderia glumae]MCQ0039620.1 conjugal transfer protein TraG N-terminal domain-containing protein [Burkholderia glumae]